MHPDRRLADYLVPELLQQLGEAVTVIGPDWRYRYVSPRAAEIIGRPVEECVGAVVWEMFPDVVGTLAHEACVRAMESRTRETLVWWFGTVGRWFEQHALPVADGLVVYVHDITDRLDESLRAEQLTAAGEAIAGAVTVEQVNSALVQHVHPLVGASGGTILLADEERGVMQALGWAGMDDQAIAVWSDFPLDTSAPSTTVHRSGDPLFLEGLDAVRSRFPRVADELERNGRVAVATLPLVSAGLRLGAWSLVFDRPVVPSADRRFLATTAAMVAQALLRARLLDAERRSVAQLQRSLLPRTVAEVPGLDLAVRYAAGDAAVEVGGDWYDVVPLAEGAVGLVMGDVEGHDVEAAACMGLVRSAVRAYAAEGHPPAIVMQLADRFVADVGLDRIVTVSFAHLHPVERLITTVSAGHLPVSVVSPDGAYRQIPTDIGPPLGVSDDPGVWPETTSSVPTHGVLAAFTDGLVESRDSDIDAGLGQVRDVLVAHRDDPVDDLADALLGARSARSHDDVALLVGRLTADEPAERRFTRRVPATSASVPLARRSTRQLLREWDVPADAIARVELVVSELVTNAARHSEDAVEVVLACRDDSVLRVEVADTSHRLPVVPEADVDEESTSGRGLVLVEAVADRWGVESLGLSKRVWAEVEVDR
ncbi:MAG: SpoIIE family protein phosphatase [Actinomycetes bacterium]